MNQIYSTVKEKLAALRNEMKKEGIDIYVIPTDDYHGSEYVSSYFKAREYMSGFTGSAGTLAVSKDSAILWADGRYFIQAEKELYGSEIKLYKMGEPKVPTPDEYIKSKISEGLLIGFDGRVITAKQGAMWESTAFENGISIYGDIDLIDRVWHARPQLPDGKTFLIPDKLSGESTASKLERLRKKIKAAGASCHLTSTLDEIAWLYNMRGSDVLHTPVFLSYTIIFENHCILYIDENKLDEPCRKHLKKNNINILPYEQIYTDLKKLDKNHDILIDTSRINYSIKTMIPDDQKTINLPNPIQLMKALKNDVEQKNIRNAYLKDGIACTKFMFWLKTNVGKIPMDEISVADYLESLRREQPGFIDLSFSTICAYKEHAAMMHYSASFESKSQILPEHMLLVDSGAHYDTGTTDITRTFVLGNISSELKTHFTTVLRSMISLAKAKFLEGATGGNLDVLAREPIWQLDIDYKCGTGHGVGYILSVHEGPAAFRWQTGKDQSANIPLQSGMTLTDEPGIYIEGSHGIRLENQLFVKKAEKTVFGQFMDFETVTLCPIDIDGIIPEIMAPEEKVFLNSYHKNVYKKLSPFLSEEENEWLKIYTREI